MKKLKIAAVILAVLTFILATYGAYMSYQISRFYVPAAALQDQAKNPTPVFVELVYKANIMINQELTKQAQQAPQPVAPKK